MSTVYDDESPESRPLLRSDTESQTVENKPTPLPKLQFATLCSVRIADPIAYSQIFPYINEMIYFLQLTDDPAQIGFYSGLVVCACASVSLVCDVTHDRKRLSRSRNSSRYTPGRCFLVPHPRTRWFHG